MGFPRPGSLQFHGMDESVIQHFGRRAAGLIDTDAAKPMGNTAGAAAKIGSTERELRQRWKPARRPPAAPAAVHWREFPNGCAVFSSALAGSFYCTSAAALVCPARRPSEVGTSIRLDVDRIGAVSAAAAGLGANTNQPSTRSGPAPRAAHIP